MDVTSAPWRKERPAHMSGMPAWSMRPEHYAEGLPSTLFGGIDPEWAWGGADGGGIRVCVLDSGVDGGHPLVGPVDRAWHVVGGDGGTPRAEECAATDSAGHGTACAGIVRSLAPRASISSMKVLGDGRSGSAAALIAGLAAAIEEGFDVINMSLSTARPEFRNRLAELCARQRDLRDRFERDDRFLPVATMALLQGFFNRL